MQQHSGNKQKEEGGVKSAAGASVGPMSKMDVTIKPLKTKKDDIKQPELASKDNGMMIPPLGSSVIISGKSGSGKSTLLANLLLDKRFYKGWFDEIFLFSPTANGDDIQKQLEIPKNHVFTDLEEAPQLLEVILRAQSTALEKTTADKAKQYALIFDDVIGDTKFMNTKEFTKCFYQVRHICCTTFICTQHFTRVPRICRLQASFIMYFRGSMSETEILVEEFAPPNMTKNEFRQMVVDATSDGFDFLTINMKVGWDTRFRHNLGDVITLPDMTSSSKNYAVKRTKEETEEGDGEVHGQQAKRSRSQQQGGGQPPPQGAGRGVDRVNSGGHR